MVRDTQTSTGTYQGTACSLTANHNRESDSCPRETINESTEYKYITTYGVTVFGRPNNNTTTRIEEKTLLMYVVMCVFELPTMHTRIST